MPTTRLLLFAFGLLEEVGGSVPLGTSCIFQGPVVAFGNLRDVSML